MIMLIKQTFNKGDFCIELESKVQPFTVHLEGRVMPFKDSEHSVGFIVCNNDLSDNLSDLDVLLNGPTKAFYGEKGLLISEAKKTAKSLSEHYAELSKELAYSTESAFELITRSLVNSDYEKALLLCSLVVDFNAEIEIGYNVYKPLASAIIQSTAFDFVIHGIENSEKDSVFSKIMQTIILKEINTNKPYSKAVNESPSDRVLTIDEKCLKAIRLVRDGTSLREITRSDILSANT
jgi:hypothetical protein